MKIVENTLKLTTEPYQPNEQEKLLLESLGHIIHKISCELSSNCSESQGNFEQRTLNLLVSLGQYNWEAKIIIILAGFATNYAEYFLIDEVYTNNATAKGLLQLKRLGMKDTGNIGGFVKEIVKNVMNIVKYILAIKKIQDNLSTAPIDSIDFPSSTFWIIYAILMCSSEISSHGVVTKHIYSITKKIDVIYHYFSLKLIECQRHEREEEMKAQYEVFVRLFGCFQADNFAILKHLLSCGENEELICGIDQGKKINLSVLKKGTVIVLLSSLYIDAYSEEVSVIKAFYNMTNTNNQYHIVWLPIGFKKEEKHRRTYTEVVHGKPWYHLRFESLAEQYVVLEKYAIKEWGFNEKPMLMVINNGQVIHHDALSLIHMWGHLAFPFGIYKEKDLWKKYGHNLGIQFILAYLHDDLAILGNDETQQYVCVFGGRPNKLWDGGVAYENGSTLADDEWFANLAGMLMEAALPANIKLKMAYLWANREEADLGMNIKTKVKSIINGTQYEESMRYVQVEQSNVKLFWSRTKSIALQLSMQKEYDTLDANIGALLENTRSILQFNQLQSTAWVAIGRLGTTDMIFHDAEKFFNCLEHIQGDIEKWKTELKASAGNFIKVLRGWLMGYKYETKEIKKHCFKHVVHGDVMQKGGMRCVICNKPMKKVVLYECCE